ncbi:MAG: LysR family transcriptional regulator [Gammaproteobacteria bacterium]|jgi:DNA-binding transcriptional LysR family regulator
MDIDELHAFLSVARQGSFSLAAEALHLSQPAVSKRIAALEQTLDTRLFDRIGRRIILTEAGLTLLERAEKILADVDDTRRAITNLAGEVRGRLSIATSHHIGLHRLPPVLRQFTRRYPQVQLDLCFMDSEAACRAVVHGELELAVVTLPFKQDADLILIPTWSDPLALVTAPDHPLRGHARLTLAQLGEYPAILPAAGTFTRELIKRSFLEPGLPLNVSLETNYLETIKMMVSIGLGWSLLPQTMVDRSLCVHRLKSRRVVRRLGMVHHAQRTLSNAARAFITTCRSHADGDSRP